MSREGSAILFPRIRVTSAGIVEWVELKSWNCYGDIVIVKVVDQVCLKDTSWKMRLKRSEFEVSSPLKLKLENCNITLWIIFSSKKAFVSKGWDI